MHKHLKVILNFQLWYKTFIRVQYLIKIKKLTRRTLFYLVVYLILESLLPDDNIASRQSIKNGSDISSKFSERFFNLVYCNSANCL